MGKGDTEIETERDRKTERQTKSERVENTRERIRIMERDHSKCYVYSIQEKNVYIHTFVVLVYGMLQLLEGSGAREGDVGIGDSHTSILGNQLANVNNNSKPTGVIE